MSGVAQSWRFLSVLALGVAWSVDALACGGCFNQAPPPPPGAQDKAYVVQDAERVVFLRDAATKVSTVWVEVRYTGAAQDFGWVLPLPKQPVVSVGTRFVFDTLDKLMAPRFETTNDGVRENCRDPQAGCVALPRASNDFSDAALPSDVMASGGDAGTAPPKGVEILDQGQTGPYDYTVVQSGSVDPLYEWLTKRGYKTPESAKPILADHVKKGDVFVAIKLSNGKGVDLIRPIVLTMPDAEPCVPLRLTSIAAAQEMTVSVTLGGAGRAVPKNHLHVVVNPWRLNWFNGAANYPQLVSAAIDEAGGKAFATEFAGNPAGIIDPLFLPGETKLLDGLGAAKTVGEVGNVLAQFSWQPGTSELPADVEEVLKFGAANGLTAAQAYSALVTCASQYWPTVDCKAYFAGDFDAKTLQKELAAQPVAGSALAKHLDKVFFGPIRTAAEGLQAAPVATRMLLRISPQEMDRDPIFAFNPKLPEVANLHKGQFTQVCPDGWLPATQTRLALDGHSFVFQGEPPGGVSVANNATDKRFFQAPAAARIELLDETGDPKLIDKSQIDLVLTGIAGAQPGKPSLPDGMTLKPGVVWQPPQSDAVVTKLGPWKQPPGCQPLPGWQDGQLPPTSARTQTDASGGDGGTSSDGSSRGTATDALTDGGFKAPQPSPTAQDDHDKGCTAGPGPRAGLGWLALVLAGCAAVCARRRVAVS
jgi:hypothetical protein